MNLSEEFFTVATGFNATVAAVKKRFMTKSYPPLSFCRCPGFRPASFDPILPIKVGFALYKSDASRSRTFLFVLGTGPTSSAPLILTRASASSCLITFKARGSIVLAKMQIRNDYARFSLADPPKCAADFHELLMKPPRRRGVDIAAEYFSACWSNA